jgi:hypothetical protein
MMHPRRPVILELCSTATLETPVSILEQAEAVGAEQPPTSAKQKPDRLALLEEAIGLIRQASPELRAALADFVEKEILRDPRGKIRRASDLSARVLCVAYLTTPSKYRSLAEIADRLNLSRTILSRHAKRFCFFFGFQNPPAPHPAGGPLRGVAKRNAEWRLTRRSDLVRQADEILEQAGIAVTKIKTSDE